MASLKGKTLFISGASRGIGLAIAARAARDGANVAIAAKTDKPHPKLPGTIHSAADEIRAAGGRALPLVCDIREEDQVEAAVAATVAEFGGVDAVVNNASAISLTPTEATEMRRYDLMHQINGRGTFLVTKTCVPHLRKSENPHILTLSPPLDLQPKWFGGHVAYSVAKYNMSMFVLGWAAEFASVPIAANALWPRTTIATAAIEFVVGASLMNRSRTPEIMGDAAHAILTKPAGTCSGNFFIDDLVLKDAGVTDFAKYKVDPEAELQEDFFLPDDTPPMPG